MNDRTTVLLNPALWEKAQSKQELKQLIGNYMAKSYPGYRVVEIHKYYAVCEVMR